MFTAEQYQNLWDTMTINDNDKTIKAAKLILRNKERYQNVVKDTLVPWEFIGLTHYRESGCDFKCHPHEGSPLTARTKFVPKGRPMNGEPPFTWEESAQDCYFTLKQLNKAQTWDLPSILRRLEAFNGMGYQLYHPEVLSPYLWANTNNYVKGKYMGDGKFNSELVDKQVGCAPIYRYLTDKELGLV